MNQEMLERMSVSEILEINVYFLESSDLLLMYRELIWRLRPMVFSLRADDVISRLKLVESLLRRTLEKYEETRKILDIVVDANDDKIYTTQERADLLFEVIDKYNKYED